MSEMPQVSMDTEHCFHGGMYCRTIKIPAGSVIVSRVHKTDHLFIGIEGELAVSGEGESYTLTPGKIVYSPKGTKRAVTALTDVVCMTIHRTDKKTIEGLEEEMIESDGLPVLHDVSNQFQGDKKLEGEK